MHFNTAGDRTLALLSDRGIKRKSKTLDIGCGCLRIGIKLINYLEPEKYFGIEPNKPMLDTGIKYLLSDSLRELKNLHFLTMINSPLKTLKLDYSTALLQDPSGRMRQKQRLL